MKEVVWCFTYIKEMTLRQNYKEVYKLWRERNPLSRISKSRCKGIVQPEELHFKSSEINGC